VLPAEFVSALGRSVVAMSGTFTVDNQVVRFRPRHPFVDGLTYSWILREAGLEPQAVSISRPDIDRPRIAEVTAILPTAARLPFNLLRLYVYFSMPMSEGDAWRCVRLQVAETGAELAGAILTMEPELWDREHRRLTVLLDPGRIKRGLVPNTQAGYPLAEGATVSLVVEDGLRDATGARLRAGACRDYAIGAALRGRVDPAQWRVEPPPEGTAQPLTVRFDRPLDHALLGRCLHVTGPSGAAVRGRTRVASGELSWQFTPENSWTGGRYQLRVDSKLEDVAGNSIARVFDRDLDCADDDPVPAKSVAVDFVIGD
jgi:hypothetical protein